MLMLMKKEFKEKLNIEKLKAYCIYKNKFQLHFIIYFIGFFTNKEKYFFAYKNKKCIKLVSPKSISETVYNAYGAVPIAVIKTDDSGISTVKIKRNLVNILTIIFIVFAFIFLEIYFITEEEKIPGIVAPFLFVIMLLVDIITYNQRSEILIREILKYKK